MGHDVYICYDEKDSEYADTICSIFEQNNIKTWIKSKDMSSNDSVDKITQAIENSKCFVLILSNHSKDTNYVLTEIDIAFSRNIPIISFNIDDLRLDGNLEWILENQTIIPLFPNAKKQLKTLVKETSEIIEKPLNKIKIGFKSIKKFEKINPGKKRYIIKKSIEIAIPIFIVLLLVFICIILPTGQNTTEDGVFSMNITDVDVSESGGNYKYTVFGESYNLPSDYHIHRIIPLDMVHLFHHAVL